MKRIRSLVIFAFGFLILSNNVFADTSNITNLTFISTSQELLPDTLSAEIKVQAQNSSGIAESVSETNDVTFTTNSSSGEFLNGSGNAVSRTMSKNTSSRAFYYRDSNTGTFTLTVEIKGRDSGKTFLSSQNIIISNSTNIGGIGASTSTTTTNASTTTTVVIASTTPVTETINASILSSHSNTQNVTYIFESPQLKIDAGRHRLATNKSPIEFEAGISGGDNASYVWSFGDGTSETGKRVSHLYKFIGDYNVVLNVRSGGVSAVSRTEVKVINPEVRIMSIDASSDGFVELKNDSSYEVNLENWKLVSDKTEIIIAADTIMRPNSSVKLPFIFVGNNFSIRMIYPNGSIAYVPDNIVRGDVAYIEPTQDQIEEAKVKVAREFANQNMSVKIDPTENNNLHTKELENVNPNLVSTSSQGISLINSFESDNPKDNSLLATPGRFFRFISNFFTK
jgi:hypothetical protein